MAGFNGKAFLLGIQHLDITRGESFTREDPIEDNCGAESIDDDTLRLIGPELHADPFGTDRHR